MKISLPRDGEMASVDMELAVQAWGPEADPLNPHKTGVGIVDPHLRGRDGSLSSSS